MDLHGLIARRIEAGDSVELIDRNLLGSLPGLSADQRAALWLYARHIRQASGAWRESGGVVHEANSGSGRPGQLERS